MLTIETADEKEVRRFRMALFNGRTTTVRSGDTLIIGHVRSVQQQQASVPPRWIITIIPSPPKPGSVPLHPGSRTHSLSEDIC